MNQNKLIPALLLVLSASCRGEVSWIPDSTGKFQAIHNDVVKLPGLDYLQLGGHQGDIARALRARGYDCSEEASTSNTLACLRPPGKDEPTGGVVMLLFDHALLAGVQAQLQPPGDETGKLARQRYDELTRDWTRAYGHPIEVARPGVKVTRFNLRNGTALFLAYYDHEPDTIHVEHSLLVADNVTMRPGSER